ncbi:MAG: UDP-N-acetylmuramoyl-tripeptide--D-alanyl-D-alanine ligase [Paludibacteraceae bacterium]|nr:UDP-N-acetylmuramoyl-tripeptide--D-alanyl-D-alanine ligase [Paludibacteraceae bacterium]MBN2787782.1 UDP-N-acetylmuramoyl-tripeptide--D-alanyl-D-alanine ligase [Paludibacteraceae bacterium]
MNTELLYQLYLQHPTITTDSRTCPSGSLFFALKGTNFNGNAYAASALKMGCAFAVVDEKEYAVDERYIVVRDVLQSLQELAHHHRIALGLPVIGITGTNGKTTTKELIAAVLKQKFSIYYTQGNLNNHIGVPLTLLSLTKAHQLAVIEMGANHPGEIKTLVDIACPNVGLITNVGKAHLEGFGSFEGVIKTKSELYDFLRETGGQAFVNLDNPILYEKSEGINRIGYGIEKNNGQVQGEITANAPFLAMRWHNFGDTAEYQIETKLIGAYNAENVLAAVCVGRYFDVDSSLICEAINKYTPQNNRSQLTETAHNKLVVDAYNANPTSMRAAIQNFAAMEAPKKALILGDMLELGNDSGTEHQCIVDLLVENKFDKVFLVGECFSKTNTNYPVFSDVIALISEIPKQKFQNYYILIKGSRGIKLEKTLSYL